MSLVFFVSHSHKDRRLAEGLVTFLQSGVGVETKEIRCTSQLSAGLAGGANVSKQLRKDIKKCQYFLPLVTANSMASEYVHFEIGAAWAFEKDKIVPLVFMPRATIAIPSLLREFHFRDVSKLDELMKLAHELTSDIFVKSDQSNATQILGAATTFLSHISNRRENVSPKRPPNLE